MVVTTSLEGTNVFRELQADLERAKGSLVECQAETERLDGQMRDLLAQRGEALLKLARLYLPEMSRSAIESTFEGIRGDLLDILARREARRKELQTQIAQGNEEIRRRNAEIDDVTARLNEKVALRERLEAKVAEILKGNADFQERSKLALQAEEKLHRDEKRVEDMAKEAAEKLPHYDRSRLFRYLYDRGFGTSAYQSKGLVLTLDRWVADLIDYPNARNGYEFLKTAHGLVDAEVARRRDQFTDLMKQVEAIEKGESDKVGLTAVLAEGDALGTERDRFVHEQDRLQKQAQDLQRALAEVDQAQNEFYKQAIERFRAFLGKAKLVMLRNRARQTPEPDDDAIVAELADLDGRIDEITPRLASLGDRRTDADRVQAGLDWVLRQYRLANYDSDRSYFEGLDLRQLKARYEEGGMKADDLWREIQSAQKFRPNWVDSTVQDGTQIITGPSGRVILGAIVDIADAAMRNAAYRGVQRRSSDASFPSFPTFPTFPSSGGGNGGSSWPSLPSSGSEGGFTTGDGF
jgi:hypothetical protein